MAGESVMVSIKERVWQLIAWVVSREPIANLLIKQAHKTPYFNLPGYMDRDWLFNPYNQETHQKRWEWLPSIRVHHILRADLARHPHDHPWNARTIILGPYYKERRLLCNLNTGPIYEYFTRKRGQTATINFGEYHAIDEVPEGGVWTLFITFKFMGGWGFLVDGKKMPWREYEAKYPT